MLDNIREGFLGFILVLSGWLSGDSQGVGMKIHTAVRQDSLVALTCIMDLDWNDEMTQLVDAGIPIRFSARLTTDAGDSSGLVRIVRFDLAEKAYRFADSAVTGRPDTLFVSTPYRHMRSTLRDLSRCEFAVSKRTRAGRIEVELWRSRASRLNRTVDLTHVWGRRKLTADFQLLERTPEERWYRPWLAGCTAACEAYGRQRLSTFVNRCRRTWDIDSDPFAGHGSETGG